MLQSYFRLFRVVPQHRITGEVNSNQKRPADVSRSLSILSPFKQGEFQPFSPDLNRPLGVLWLNHQSVCFLLESLPPPDTGSKPISGKAAKPAFPRASY